MSKLLFTMTDAGRQELVNANKTGTNKVEIVSVGLGSRYYVTSTSQTNITNEIKRLTTIGGKVVSPDTIHVTAKDDSKDEYVVHTIGLYTNKGTLFAVYSQEQAIINKASSTIALISSDIAIKTLDTKNITFGDIEFINPPATETVVGVARFANEQEIDAGTDDSLAVSAKRLKQAIVKHEQSRNHPDATLTSKGFVQLSSATNSSSETLAATPKAVKAAYDLAAGKAPSNHTHSWEQITNVPVASLTVRGITQLSSATNSTSETLAATSKAVKVVMDETNKKAPLNSPALTGTPTTPTAPKGTNNTQIASTAYVMAAIAALVDSSPDALNTLNELAAALGNDPNFATTMTNALAGKQPKDATLTALAELATSADKLPYFTGANRAALTALTSVGREIISKTSTEDVLDYLRLTEIIDKFHSQITTCERNSRVENFYTLAETCTAELLSLNAPEAYDKSITLTVNEELTTDYTGPVTGHCSIGDPQSYTIAMCTSTTLEYQVSSVVLESDGTFSFARSWPGAKAFKLYRTSNNGLVTVREDPLCIRSYRMPSDAGDETVRVMKDRTYTYDQAVSAIALMAQGHSQTERFVRGLCAIVGSGGSEGSVPFFVNRMSAQTSSQYYRTGNAAWVAYALAYYLLKYPDGEMAVVARDKLTQCAEWIETFRVAGSGDIRSGLYTSGSGQYLNGVFYPDFDADWCASEHQFDLWFLF
ncbi:tail fiber protein, partial [Escherichia coli]